MSERERERERENELENEVARESTFLFFDQRPFLSS